MARSRTPSPMIRPRLPDESFMSDCEVSDTSEIGMEPRLPSHDAVSLIVSEQERPKEPQADAEAQRAEAPEADAEGKGLNAALNDQINVPPMSEHETVEQRMRELFSDEENEGKVASSAHAAASAAAMARPAAHPGKLFITPREGFDLVRQVCSHRMQFER